MGIPAVPSHTCPFCKASAVTQCKCERGDMQCKNGHEWHHAGPYIHAGKSDHSRPTCCSGRPIAVVQGLVKVARGSSYCRATMMDPLTQRVAVKFAREINAEAEGQLKPNVPRLKRIVDSIEKEAKDMVAAFKKYQEDPERYHPQLENMIHGASILGTDVRVLLRSLGAEA